MNHEHIVSIVKKTLLCLVSFKKLKIIIHLDQEFVYYL